jgi:hypothetical protein
MTSDALALPDGHFLLLLAIYTGQQLGVDDGALTLEVPGEPEPVAIPSLPAALDELESRGWVVIVNDMLRVTEQGDYWLRRWMTKKTKVRGSFYPAG